jgi:DNA-binding MarR family transcriptional regulator
MESSMTTPAASNILTPMVCRLSRLSTLFMGREMTRGGYGPGQYFLLSEVYDQEGLTQDELSRRVGVDKSNTSRALARLEGYGLVERRVSDSNYKEKQVYLTPKARVVEPEFRAVQHGWNNILLAGFSEEEKQVLFSGLTRMLENAQAHIQDGI